MTRYLIFLTIILLFGCGSEPIPPDNFTPAPVSDEAELLTRNAALFVTKPTTDAQRQRNELIDYAIDQKILLTEHPRGFFYHIVERGDGPTPAWGDRVTANYQGSFLDGRYFDSSYQRGEPLSFLLGNMVPGWNFALQEFPVGTRAILLLPSEMGYGERGFGELIPPGTPLRFDLKVLDVEKQ